MEKRIKIKNQASSASKARLRATTPISSNSKTYTISRKIINHNIKNKEMNKSKSAKSMRMKGKTKTSTKPTKSTKRQISIAIIWK